MAALMLPDEPIPLWWTADFIICATGECWTTPEVQKWVVGEFNCSCVGLSKCLPAYCKDDTPNVSYKDIPEQEKKDATIYGNIVGKEAAKMHPTQQNKPRERGDRQLVDCTIGLPLTGSV